MTGGLYNPRPVDDVPVDGQLEHGLTSNWGFDHAADLDAHTFQMQDRVRTGSYIYFGMPGTANSIAPTAGWLVGNLIRIPRALTINAMNIHITGAGAGGTVVRLLIYNIGINFAGGTLLLNAGTVPADGARVVLTREVKGA